MNKLFNERMTYPEAQKVFFSSLDGKTGNEIENIKKEYAEILPAIIERELRENEGVMTSYQL